MQEPSVLDYFKAKLKPWRGPAPQIPPLPSSRTASLPAQEERVLIQIETPVPDGLQPALAQGIAPAAVVSARPRPAVEARQAVWPWRSLLALFLALVAQASLEPHPDRTSNLGIGVYLLAAVILIWSNLSREWSLANLREDAESVVKGTITDYYRFILHPSSFMLSLVFGLGAFLSMGDNLFTEWNVLLWMIAIGCGVYAFWEPGPALRSFPARLLNTLRRPSWQVRITPWTLVVVGAIAVVAYFRLYNLVQVPSQMVSDHAEKLLDVSDVINGQTHIFFIRNTGREMFQFYLTAAVIKLFGTGISFLSLKIGTAIAGLVTLVYMYLLGKEIANREVGLAAAVFMGIAYWPNVITRIALRFTLYPLFVAPTLYYLIRGLRRRQRNDFILAGLFLGLGLQGYTPFRIVPIIVVIAVGLYMLHRQSKGARESTFANLVVLTIMAVLVFLPLGRYAIDNPDMFGFRALSRLGSVERPLPGPAWQIFVSNTWHAVTMFNWDDGETWPVSVTHRPALDTISAGLFFLGVVLLIFRYLRRRHWQDLFLLLSVPLLMLPSILSLAFPNENPAPNRAAGAAVPVFIIIALALHGLMEAFRSKMGKEWGSRFAWGTVGLLLVISMSQNYDLVFNQYASSYEAASWNTSELGQVIREFTNTIGSPDKAWVVAYPYWVDTRLVGINAGYPTKDYAVWPDHFRDTLAVPGPKLFLIKVEDTQDLQSLEAMYPKAFAEEYHSSDPNKNFWILTVPPG